jgi:hypothetical protein
MDKWGLSVGTYTATWKLFKIRPYVGHVLSLPPRLPPTSTLHPPLAPCLLLCLRPLRSQTQIPMMLYIELELALKIEVSVVRASIWETSCLERDNTFVIMGLGIRACQGRREIRPDILGTEQCAV